MGIKSFFSKIGSGIRKGWEWAKGAANKVVDVGGRILKPVINIAQKGSGLLSYLPGTIGTVAKWVHGGLDKVKGWIDKLPDGSVKTKLNSFVDSGTDTTRNIEGKLTDGANAANRFVQDRVMPMFGGAKGSMEKIANMVKKNPKLFENMPMLGGEAGRQAPPM